MSTNPQARAWVEARADALAENFRRIRAHVRPDVGILPMVKADAYGLGMAEVVDVLEVEEPWGWGVATVEEGARLRALRVARPILVCSPVPHDELLRGVALGLQLSISSLEALAVVGRAAPSLATPVLVHIDVDTGMGRSGFDWRSAREWLPAVAAASTADVRWVGIHTHLHSADVDPGSVREQWERFSGVLRAAEEIGARPPDLLVHVLNSAGAFGVPEHACDLVRPGIFLYGGDIGEGRPAPEPVVAVRARVVHVREVPEGTTVGYGATYRAGRTERWATLAIGYGDGLPRALGNRGSALIAGRRVPIIGRISMDLTVVDITGLPQVAVGDVATLIGSDGGESIDLDDVAREAGTIGYEILTGLTPRLPRVWTGPRRPHDG
jgi:alanine racemase